MEGNILDFNSWTEPMEGNHDMNFDFKPFGEDYQPFDLTPSITLSGSNNTSTINTLPSLSTTPTFQILPNIPQSSISAAISPPSPVQIFQSPTITFPAVVYCSWCGQVTGTGFTPGASVGTPRFFNKDSMTNAWSNPQLRWNDVFGPHSVGAPFIGNRN
jgi:hypothetical protein